MRYKAEFKPGVCAIVASAVSRGASIFGASSDDTVFLKLTKSELIFGFAGSGDRVECWLKFSAESTFNGDVICESIREDVIDIAVSVGNLVSTLKHAAKAKQTSFRLSRGAAQQELLVFELRFTSGEISQEKLLVFQNMPVSVIRDISSVKLEPRLPDPTVKFELLGLSRIREVLDKMKIFKINSCEIIVSEGSQLSLCGFSDGVRVEANLTEVPVLQGSDANGNFPVSKLALLVTQFSALPSSGCTAALLASDFYFCLWTSLEGSVGSFTAILPALVAT